MSTFTSDRELRPLVTRLGALIRRRFPAADGIVCSCGDGDTILWQVVAGHDVIWNALPDVQDQIPQWHGLPDAADILHEVVTARGVEGDLVVVRLP